MSNNPSRVSQFFQELKRRRVFRVAAVYLGSAFVILEASEMVFPRLVLPDWSITLVMVLLGIGFPVAIIFSWIFDKTEAGIVRTETQTLSKPAEADQSNELESHKAATPSAEINAKSIAVLPFSSINKSKDDEVLCDGITENILTHLAKIGSMKVVSRTSVMQYKNTTKSIREIGNELEVASILEGSVQRAGDRIRITGQLIATESDEHLWADSYDKDYVDIFEIQSDVAQKIASALHTTLSPEEQKRITEEKPTTNMEAYDYFLKGIHLWHTSYTKDGNQQAVEMFDKATGLDPDFATAYARSAFVSVVLYVIPTWDHTPERLERAKTALDKANALDPDHPDTHRANGLYAQATNKLENAHEEYEKAFKIQPNDYDTPLLIAGVYEQLGNWTKAEEYFKLTYEISPRDIDPAIKLGRFYNFMGDNEKSEYYLKHAISYHPEQEAPYCFLALSYINSLGDTAQARQLLDQAGSVVLNPDSEILLYPKFHIEIYERDFSAAKMVAREHKKHDKGSLLLGYCYFYADETELVQEEFFNLASYYEDILKKDPADQVSLGKLGFIMAVLGKNKKALDFVTRADSLVPLSKDQSRFGLGVQLDLTHAYIVLNMFGPAIEKLKYFINNPGFTKEWDLRLDPIYDSLRDNPEFQKLIAEGD